MKVRKRKVLSFSLSKPLAPAWNPFHLLSLSVHDMGWAERARLRDEALGYYYGGRSRCSHFPDLVGNTNREKSVKRIVETAVQARAGFLDRPVLVVLGVSTILAVGLLFLTGVITL